MWKCEIFDRTKAPSWFGNKDIIELNETQFKHWHKMGAIVGIEHFRYETEYKKCKSCGTKHKHRFKIQWKPK